MKTILITGGTGFIGTPLVAKLKSSGYALVVIARKPGQGYLNLELTRDFIPQEVLESASVIIHLAGEPIFQRWTPRVKQAIYDSRILSTRNIVASLRQAKQRPSVLITASATGYYGNTGEEIVKEIAPPGDGFLAKVCIDWETEARQAESLGMRTVQIRTAPVLDSNGGVLAQLIPWYKLGLGSIWGNGQQWFPWISLTDIVAVYCTALEQTNLSGPINAVAPQITRQETFARTLAERFHQRLLFRIPSWGLRIILGEFGNTLLDSQHVVPQKLINRGYTFQHPTLPTVFDAALHTKKPPTKAPL